MDRLRTSDWIIDIGCGQGLLLSCLQVLNCDNLIGLDISPILVKKTRECVKRVDGVVADVHHLPFRNEGLRIIFALDTIEHWQDPLLGMTEIARVARNDGRIVIATDAFHCRFLQKLGLFEISSKEQPIEKAVHPLVFEQLLNTKLKQLAYFSWGFPLPMSFTINLLRKYRIDLIGVIKKILKIRKRKIETAKHLISSKDLIRKISFYRSKVKKGRNFPIFRYLFFSSSIALLLRRTTSSTRVKNNLDSGDE